MGSLARALFRDEFAGLVEELKQVGDSAYVWGGEGESCPFHVVMCVCGWCGVHYFVLYLLF